MGSPGPGQPSKQDWILGDADAIIQLVACDKLSILKVLQSQYGISTVIPESVEMELRNLVKNRRFQDVHQRLTKAFNNGLLTVLEEATLSPLVGSNAHEAFERIDRLGEKFRRLGVGSGEAYAHAAGIELSLPVLSNDGKAINVLMANGATLPGPFLRTFDVLVFGRQIAVLSDHDCDAARQELARRNEGITSCFMGRSFTEGLQEFYPRLVDGAAPLIGATHPRHSYDSRRLIVRAK